MRCKFIDKILTVVAVFAATFALAGCGGDIAVSPDIKPHLISTADVDYVAPIEHREEFVMPAVSGTDDKAYRARMDLLYTAVVYDGKKPVFAENDPAKPVYDAAIALLSRYVRQDWHTGPKGEFEIVHALHDYLVSAIEYDFSLYSSFLSGADVSNDPSFHIDGVLLNRTAVCDGLSRAFVFLCAIEGIDALRITGSFASAPHAWNKVKLGGDWYNLDVTGDAVYYSVGSVRYKQLSHGFFLLSDKTISEFKPNGYDFTPSPFIAECDYDYHGTCVQSVDIGGKTYSSVVASKNALVSMFKAISGQKGKVGKIELKLDFPGKTQVNMVDMYTDDIAAAYAQLDDPGFDFSTYAKPYFRFPNGVYLFLMYK